MIPATIPYVASFRVTRTARDGSTKTSYETEPVVAWEDNGDAMIAGDHGLVRAVNRAGFYGLMQAADERVVGAVPADGWRLAWLVEDGEPIVERVLCWLVKANGMVEPVTVDGDGVADQAHRPFDDTDFRLVPPAEPEATR